MYLLPFHVVATQECIGEHGQIIELAETAIHIDLKHSARANHAVMREMDKFATVIIEQVTIIIGVNLKAHLLIRINEQHQITPFSLFFLLQEQYSMDSWRDD